VDKLQRTVRSFFVTSKYYMQQRSKKSNCKKFDWQRFAVLAVSVSICCKKKGSSFVNDSVNRVCLWFGNVEKDVR